MHARDMASYTKKGRKTDPSFKRNKSTALDTETRFRLGRTGQLPTQLFKIDIPRIMSYYNHRLYRQCGVYRARIDLETSSLTADGFTVVTLANTWHVKRSIQTARDMHDQAMSDELAMAGRSRWYDFRIFEGSAISAGQADLVIQAGATPQSIAEKPFVGEWFTTGITDAAGNSRQFTLSGPTTSASYNIFQEYDLLGNSDTTPVVTSTLGGYDGIEASIDSANVDKLLKNGNSPPYSDTDLPDEVFVSRGKLFRQSNLSGVSRESTGFFDAPLGLVWIYMDSEITGHPSISLTVQGGSYKGVSMTPY